MINATSNDWVVDLGTMTCRNILTNMVVVFEKKRSAIIGKIKDLPLEIMAEWAERLDGATLMQGAVLEAEGVFLHAYFENEMGKEERSEKNQQILRSIFILNFI